MGLFSSPAASHTSPKASSDGAYEAPDRNARRACWTARDAFFTCLDRNGIIDSIRNDGEAKKCCGEELKGLEKDCAASWVTYFQQRRVMEYNKKKTLEKLLAEGAKPMPEGMGPPQGPAGLSR